MTEKPPPKPPPWTDILLTVWVVVVGVIYFGGYLVPAIGALTPNVAAFYALMVLISVLVLTARFLRRDESDKDIKDTRTKNRKKTLRD